MAQGQILWKETFKDLALRVIPVAMVVGLVIGVASWAHSGNSHRDADGQIAAKGDLGAGEIALGDCFQDPGAGAVVSSVTAVPCSQPHTSQVYWSFDYPLDPSALGLPDDSTLAATVDPACAHNWDSQVDSAKLPAGFGKSYMRPDERSWDLGRRRILCTVTADQPWTGSAVKGWQ